MQLTVLGKYAFRCSCHTIPSSNLIVLVAAFFVIESLVDSSFVNRISKLFIIIVFFWPRKRETNEGNLASMMLRYWKFRTLTANTSACFQTECVDSVVCQYVLYFNAC